MIISAISDLDVLEMNYDPFFDLVKKAKKPDLLLFAGDMYEYRSPESYGLLLDFLKLKKWNCPIIAVFGNREFDEDIDDIRKITKKRIKFLDDESHTLKIENRKIGIVGSRGSLDSSFLWDSTSAKKIEKLLKGLRADIKILLTHFAPTYKTLKGENKRYYDGMGTEKLEEVLIKSKTTFAVHGHSHYGIPLAFVGSVPVFNVCFLVNKKIVEINPDKLSRSDLK